MMLKPLFARNNPINTFKTPLVKNRAARAQKAWGLLVLLCGSILWQSIANVAVAFNEDFKRLEWCNVESDTIEFISIKTGQRIELANPLHGSHHEQLCDFCLTGLDAHPAIFLADFFTLLAFHALPIHRYYSMRLPTWYVQNHARAPPVIV